MRKLLLLFLICLIIFPSSSAYLLHGTVLDENNNIVSNVGIKIDCQDYSQSLETDKFGSFVSTLTKSPCVVSARYGSYTGYKEIKVNPGQDYIHIDIKADKLILKKKIYNYIILIAIIIGLIFLINKFRNKSKSSKINNILRVLTDKEKLILDEIKRQRGNTTQSRLYHITKIPKVSLSRYIKTLEKKKLIQTESFGKLKKIKFSKWFKKLF